MYDQFEETEEFRAVLIINEREQGTCKARLTYNPYDLNNMDVEIFNAPELSIPELPENPDFSDYERLDARLLLNAEGLKRTVTLRSDALSSLELPGFMSSFSDTIPVEEYRIAQWWESDKECAEVGISYQFPLTTAVRDRSVATRDARYGYYHGERDKNESAVQLEKDSFTIDTPTGEAEFVETYGTHKLNTKRTYPAITLIRKSGCYFNLDCDTDSPHEAIQEVRQEANTLLHLLSFAEQNRINWSMERTSMKSEKGDLIGQIKTYRWVPPTSEKYRPNASSLRNVRESFKEICNAYYSLGSSTQSVIDQAIENFKRTNCTETLETNLVFWYSCLDHITKKLYGSRQRPFSKRLVNVCVGNGIEISDLLSSKVIRHFQENLDDEHDCFWFVDARNRFVHEGLDALQHESYQLIEEIRNARALAERLLLHKLGLDHDALCDQDKFCLGQPSIRQ